jgi:hypothetical protein
MPQPGDIRPKQRRWVAQPHPRIDDAVVDEVASGHGRAQRVVIENVAVTALDIEIVDALSGTGAAHHDSHICTCGNKLPRDM